MKKSLETVWITMKKTEHSFTFTELIIVIATVAFLAVISFPAYQSY